MTDTLNALLGSFLAWVKAQPPQRRKTIYTLAAGIAFAAIVVVLTFAGNHFTLWSYRFVIPPRVTVIAWLIPLIAPLLAIVHLTPSGVVAGEKAVAAIKTGVLTPDEARAPLPPTPSTTPLPPPK